MTQVEVPAVRAANERVAAEVRAEIARQRISQSRLRLMLGMSQSAMSRRMTGERAFEVGELAAIAVFLDVPVSRFFQGEPITDGGPVGPRPTTRNNRYYSPGFAA